MRCLSRERYVESETCRTIAGNIAEPRLGQDTSSFCNGRSLENEFYIVLVPWYAFIASLNKFRGKTRNVFRSGIAVSRSARWNRVSFLDSLYRLRRFASDSASHSQRELINIQIGLMYFRNRHRPPIAHRIILSAILNREKLKNAGRKYGEFIKSTKLKLFERINVSFFFFFKKNTIIIFCPCVHDEEMCHTLFAVHKVYVRN